MKKESKTPDAVWSDVNATERKNMEDELSKNAEEISDLYHNAPCGYHSLDADGTFFRINDTELRWLGYTRDEIIGKKKFIDIITPNGRRTFQNTFPILTKQGWISNVESEMIRKDGSILPVLLNATAIMDKEGNFIMSRSTLFDNTERKRAKEALESSYKQLRALAGRLQTVREEERKLIAREIHDELGGALTGLKIDLSTLGSSLAKKGDETERNDTQSRMKEMTQLIDSSIHTVRRIVSELRPGILDDLGISAALEWQLQEFEKRTGIKGEFISNREDIQLNEEASTALFRIFQESLTNIARHADATKVTVRLMEASNKIIMEVNDNGSGIKESEINDHKSLGLLGMRERALLLGGNFNVFGAPGEGTTISVQIQIL